MQAAVFPSTRHKGAVYYGGDNANGFDFAQAGLRTDRRF